MDIFLLSHHACLHRILRGGDRHAVLEHVGESCRLDRYGYGGLPLPQSGWRQVSIKKNKMEARR